MSVNVECPPKQAGRRAPAAKRSRRASGRPSDRDQLIFERRALGGESLALLALEHGVSHQRIAQIAASVEGWIVAHPEDRLARRMRLRCRLRYKTVYDAAMTGFAASRREEVTLKERKTRRPAPASETRDSAETKEVVTTVEERIVRQRHGDPRLLATALKAVEKLERLAAAVGDDRLPADQTPRADKEAENREAENREAENREAENLEADEQKNGDPETDEREADDGDTDDWETGDWETGDWETNDRETDEQETADHETEQVTDEREADERVTDEQETDEHETDEHETDDQKASGHERCQPMVEQEPTSDAASGDHDPEGDHGEDGPKTIALCPRGPLVLMANGGHIEYMRSVAESAFPRYSVLALRGESEVRGWLARPDCGAALIWLEDNLGPSTDDGTPSGPAAARQLAARGADCPVLLGQGDDDEESPTYRTLCDTGLRFQVVRYGGSGWIRRDWLPALTRLVACGRPRGRVGSGASCLGG